ncbi:MAG: hypothetical protein AABX07_01330 [Nanoarchaeota archaeon]
MEEYKVLTKDLKLVDPKDYHFGYGEEDFQYLVRKEALGEVVSKGKAPLCTAFMKRVGIEWEEMSDRGHQRYQPRAALMFELASEYAAQRATSLGFPVYPIKGTNLFNLDEPAVKEHANLFGDRLYQVEAEGRRFVMITGKNNLLSFLLGLSK